MSFIIVTVSEVGIFFCPTNKMDTALRRRRYLKVGQSSLYQKKTWCLCPMCTVHCRGQIFSIENAHSIVMFLDVPV